MAKSKSQKGRGTKGPRNQRAKWPRHKRAKEGIEHGQGLGGKKAKWPMDLGNKSEAKQPMGQVTKEPGTKESIEHDRPNLTEHGKKHSTMPKASYFHNFIKCIYIRVSQFDLFDYPSEGCFSDVRGTFSIFGGAIFSIFWCRFFDFGGRTISLTYVPI